MQPENLTIAVDLANTGSTTDVDFTRKDYVSGKSYYIDVDNHSTESRRELAFFNSEPKKNGNFLGSRKTSFKTTREVEVDGADGTTIKTVAVAETKYSFPEGLDAATKLAIRQEHVAINDRDDIMDPLQDQGIV